jgi:hypothetical protein
MADLAASGALNCVPGVLNLEKHVSRLGDQNAARLGQRHVAAVSVKKQRPKFILQCAYLHAERRLRDIETTRRTAEMQFFGHS